MLAVRTVSEDADVRVIEGLAYPFKGRDTYGTFFSARTDFHWSLFPDVTPETATRADAVPSFIRPVTMHHGFDEDFGLDRIGGWSPVRMDDDGVWVQAQLDKRHRYYATRIKPLLDAGALGLSGGSAEHSVRIAADGEVREWPAYEQALTPVESNPLAQIAARTGDMLRIVEALSDPTDPATPDATRISTFTDLQASDELAEELPEALETLVSAVYGALFATDADYNPLPVDEKRAALSTTVDQFRDYLLALLDSSTAASPARAFLAAFRAGARNSAADAAAMQAAHDSIASVLSLDCAPSGDATARSGDGLPGIRLIAEPEQPDLVLRDMVTRAAQDAAATAVRRLTG